jgi:hypothetical protein
MGIFGLKINHLATPYHVPVVLQVAEVQQVHKPEIPGRLEQSKMFKFDHFKGRT